ncbi:MAG: prolyl oligopeptidase family serine peptidase [Betaproteobacteria bacterium]
MVWRFWRIVQTHRQRRQCRWANVRAFVANAAGQKIRAPVMHVYGGEDRIVAIAKGNAMEIAFERAGKPVKGYVLKEDEGHGFGKLENRVENYKKILDFHKIQFGQ